MTSHQLHMRRDSACLQQRTDVALIAGQHDVRWSDQQRYVAVRDGVLNHMAHHRGQLTVYLRLNEAKVPALYGPSADEGRV